MFEAEGVAWTSQLAYPGVLYPGENAFPGAAVEGFHEAWDAVSADWNGPGKRPGDEDALHVQTHVLEKRDLLITDDVGMLTMCRRLREEEGVEIEAMTLAEYLGQSGRALARARL